MALLIYRFSPGDDADDKDGDGDDEERWLFIEDLLQNLHLITVYEL